MVKGKFICSDFMFPKNETSRVLKIIIKKLESKKSLNGRF
ncbi:MAG: hypothetical protein YK1309IOTA_2130003 [Marine Group I thaumarchaeote]|nr:MAG: hypothetical protein YK1309IOTA_2130003 [Marine Group I thaumarchaeote]